MEQDGILGLSPKAVEEDAIFVRRLKSSGIISDPTVAFYINLDPQDSQVVFGEYKFNRSAVKSGQIGRLDASDEHPDWWTVDLKAVHYG